MAQNYDKITAVFVNFLYNVTNRQKGKAENKILHFSHSYYVVIIMEIS